MTPSFMAGCALAIFGFTLYTHAQLAKLFSKAPPTMVQCETTGSGKGRLPADAGNLAPTAPKLCDSEAQLLIPKPK